METPFTVILHEPVLPVPEVEKVNIPPELSTDKTVMIKLFTPISPPKEVPINVSVSGVSPEPNPALNPVPILLI